MFTYQMCSSHLPQPSASAPCLCESPLGAKMKEVGQLGLGVRMVAPQPPDESQILLDVHRLMSHSRRGLKLTTFQA